MGNIAQEMLKGVYAPLNGKVVSLDEVPDPVFADKVLGEGCAIIPTDGKIYSPVNGVVSSVAETLHAYGFTSDEDLEVLIHFGLETVSLKGEGFTAHVKEGDKVKVGDLIAEVDMDLIREKELNTITPVLICDGADEEELRVTLGDVKKAEILIKCVNFVGTENVNEVEFSETPIGEAVDKN